MTTTLTLTNLPSDCSQHELMRHLKMYRPKAVSLFFTRREGGRSVHVELPLKIYGRTDLIIEPIEKITIRGHKIKVVR